MNEPEFLMMITKLMRLHGPEYPGDDWIFENIITGLRNPKTALLPGDSWENTVAFSSSEVSPKQVWQL